jgi:16S rRNA (guanine527-N7)-methyltransferase
LRSRVRVVAERAEDVGRKPEYREQFAVAVAKGLAPLPILLELTLPLLSVGGLLVAWKGPAAKEEIGRAANALHVLHGEVRDVIPYALQDDPATRNLVIVRKKKATPTEYPRRAGMPKKSPL